MKWILAALFLLLTHPVWAVPAFDNSTGNYTAGTPATVTVGFTPGGTNRLLTVCAQIGGTTISSMTFNGVGLSTVATPLILAGGLEASYWRLVNPATSGDLVVTPVDAGGDLNLTIVSYKDVDPTTPLGTPVSTSGVLDTVSVAPSSASGELVADCIGILDGAGTVSSPIPTAPQAGRAASTDDVGSGGFFAVESSDKAGAAGSVTMEWTWDGSFQDVAQFAVSLKPVAAPTGVARRRIVHVD